MLSKIHPKYKLKVVPKEGTHFNPVHNYVNEATATIIDVKIGERGWIAYLQEEYLYDDSWHRLHTSIIEDVKIDENGNIIIITQNTYYFLEKIITKE